MLSCVLCLNVTTVTCSIDIKRQKNDKSTIADIIKQHFWFSDKILCQGSGFEVICKTCWHKLRAFHIYYGSIISLYKILESSPKSQIEQLTLSHEIYGKEESKSDNAEESVSQPNTRILKSSKIDTIEEASNDNQLVVKTTDEFQNTQIKTEHDLIKLVRDKPCSGYDPIDNEKIKTMCNMNCDICSDPHESFASARRHYRDCHGIDGYIMCCNRKFKLRIHLLDHLNAHLNIVKYRCPICNKALATKAQLNFHIRNHGEKNHECDLCGKKVATKIEIRSHIFRHQWDKLDRSFQCNHCEKKFKCNYQLTKHFDVVHDPNINLVCEICSRIVKGHATLASHLKTHQKIKDEDKLPCTLCGQLLKNKKAHTRHVRMHKEALKDHICPQCSKNYPHQDALKKHIRAVHEAIRNHNCRFCEKTFASLVKLKEHEAVHSGINLYTCQFCDYSCKNNPNLLKHRRQVHPIEHQNIVKARENGTSKIKT